MRFKKVISYLELEGQGRGIIMEVTRPLPLGPFYLVKWPINPNILATGVPKDQVNLLPEAAVFASLQQNRTKLHQNLPSALTSIHTTQVIAKPLKLFFREKTLAF